MTDEEKLTLNEFHMKMGKLTNGGVWGVLDNMSPTAEEFGIAIEMAFTSRFHWRKVGTITNDVRAVYMISRVYAHWNRGEPAVHYGKMMLELAQKAEKEDKENWAGFDMPFVYEALAKAYAADGKNYECAKYQKMSQELIDKLEGKEDKEICQGELDKLNC